MRAVVLDYRRGLRIRTAAPRAFRVARIALMIECAGMMGEILDTSFRTIVADQQLENQALKEIAKGKF